MNHFYLEITEILLFSSHFINYKQETSNLIFINNERFLEATFSENYLHYNARLLCQNKWIFGNKARKYMSVKKYEEDWPTLKIGK